MTAECEEDEHDEAQGEVEVDGPKLGGVDGDSAEVDEESGGDGGDDAIANDACRPGEDAGEDAESSTVAHLEELGHGHGSSFTGSGR